MTPATPSGRSGDPRKRAAATVASRSPARRRLAAIGVVLALGAGAAGLVATRGSEEPEGVGRARALVACDFTDKAAAAADRPTRARLAAAVLLLDQAVVASERAARTDAGYRSLDDAVQAVHAAGHSGDPTAWSDALDRAIATCDGV